MAYLLIEQILLTFTEQFTGSYAITGLTLSAILIGLLLATGLEFKYALPVSLPVIGGFVAAGWFGEYDFFINVILIIVAIIYGTVMMKLLNN